MIRVAVSTDAEAIAQLHVRTWQKAYAGIIPADYLTSLSIPAYVERWRRNLANPLGPMLVDIHAGNMIGWISFGHARDEDKRGASEIYGLYVTPDFWGSDAGWELLQAAEHNLEKTPETILWVFSHNARAIRFYEREGYCFDSHGKTFHFGESDVAAKRMSKVTS